jgi:serine/threonine-protein kinase
MPIDVGPLGAVLEAAGTIDPADRLDAIGLARALDGVAAKLPLPDPLPLAGSAVRGEAEQDNSPTDYPGRPRLFDGEQADVDGSRATATPAGGGLLDSSATSDRKSTSEVVNRPEVTATVKGPAGDSDRSGRTGRRRWRWVALVVGLLVLLGGATAGALVAAGAFEPSHVVPHLIGDTQAEAAGLLRPLHLHLVVSGRVYDAQAPAGTVISQRPETGRLEEGRPVDATLSLGPAPVAVPARLTGLSESAAAAVLETLSLRPGAVTHASSMTVLAGDVISSTPNSGTLLPGQTVALVISTGKPTVAIPTLSGASLASFAAAQSALGAVQLVATENQAYSFTVAAGHVIGISPPAGTKAIVGSQVTVNISKGPHVVAVPDVEDDSVGAASQALSAAGFEVSGVTGNPIATVTGTSPGGGVMADYGSSVQIITS